MSGQKKKKPCSPKEIKAIPAYPNIRGGSEEHQFAEQTAAALKGKECPPPTPPVRSSISSVHYHPLYTSGSGIYYSHRLFEMMGCGIISPPLIPLDVLPLPTWPLKEKLCSWTRIPPPLAISEGMKPPDLSANVIR